MVISISDETKSTTAATIINCSGIKLVIPYTKTKQISAAKFKVTSKNLLNSHSLRKKMIFFLTLLSRIAASYFIIFSA